MTELNYLLPEKGEPNSAADGKICQGLSQIKETINGKFWQRQP